MGIWYAAFLPNACIVSPFGGPTCRSYFGSSCAVAQERLSRWILQCLTEGSLGAESCRSHLLGRAVARERFFSWDVGVSPSGIECCRTHPLRGCTVVQERSFLCSVWVYMWSERCRTRKIVFLSICVSWLVLCWSHTSAIVRLWSGVLKKIK